MFFGLLSALTAHGASLQDPTYISAFYTSVYPSISELNSINNNGLAVGEQLISSKNTPSYEVAYEFHSGGIQVVNSFVPTPTKCTRFTGINDAETYVGYSSVPSSTAVSGL